MAIRELDGELRCANCDSTVDESGKWIDDNQWHGEEPDWCPDCGAPLRPVR
jgi:NAD-dependent SIR2 family protein deacetylase